MEHAEHSNSNAPMEYRSEIGRLNILGFWIFLGAEIALFSTLFATYAVLHNRTAGGVLPAELFDAKLVLIMTFLLLTSSFTCGIAVHAMAPRQFERRDDLDDHYPVARCWVCQL
jgi:cytochrome aa3-600 menaquinol oxidase subunit 3